MEDSKVIDLNDKRKQKMQLTREEHPGMTMLTDYEIALLRKDKKESLRQARKLFMKQDIIVGKKGLKDKGKEE
ncbi:MAG TPA: hypothetical protein PK830_09095 [Candidatus Atribacteria bacterium]|nr:hypothetical protein [Candidatus Atribacteria bacterium]HPT79241.1 hypothetical protein [Candidatus Atribacteria bacterium]